MRLRSALAALASAAAAGLLALGCGDEPSGFSTTGMEGIPSPVRIGANLVFAQADVNGNAGPPLLVDSGSPFTLIDPRGYPTATFPDDPQVTIDLTFGQLTINGVPAIKTSVLTDGDFEMPSIVGGNVLRQFTTQLDYRGMQMTLGDGAHPTGVEEPGGDAPFGLEGGGLARLPNSTTVIAVAPTRVPITVEIEGVPRPFVLDTGASEVTVRSSVYAMLIADGRAQLSGLPIGTASGPTTASVTRARTVTVAGQTVTNTPVMTIGDDLIEGLSREVKHPVDGLLGGSFLREFLVTIAYPRGQLRLQRYAPPFAQSDEFKRVGVEIGLGGGTHRYEVGVVYPGTDAEAKQLQVGDEIISIDGQDLDNLDPIAADDALNGMVGTTKRIGLGMAGQSTLSNTIVDVLVDDLIPAPAP